MTAAVFNKDFEPIIFTVKLGKKSGAVLFSTVKYYPFSCSNVFTLIACAYFGYN